MIYGRFDDVSGRPYLEARVTIPSLECDSYVQFVFDTGADSTTLMPQDGTRLQINYDRLSFDGTASGVGGIVNRSVVDASILFYSDQALYGYRINLVICEPHDDLMALPSLLGRNVIDRWRVIYDRPNSILSAEDVNYRNY